MGGLKHVESCRILTIENTVKKKKSESITICKGDFLFVWLVVWVLLLFVGS